MGVLRGRNWSCVLVPRFLGLNIGNFRISFRQPWTMLRFGFDLGANVFGFCGVFWYHINSVTNHEGTKRCPVLYESKIWAILCVLLKKIYNMLLCVRIMLICA